MMPESLTSKYNKLFSFRHEEVIIWIFEYLSFMKDLQLHLHVLLQAPFFEYTKGRDTSAISND